MYCKRKWKSLERVSHWHRLYYAQCEMQEIFASVQGIYLGEKRPDWLADTLLTLATGI